MCVCDPNTKEFVPKDILPTDIHKGFAIYKTLDNYAIGFVVYIGKENDKNKVYIYGRTNNIVTRKYNDETVIFDNLVKEYEPLEIFIGNSPKNKMTEFSGGYGNKWDGNSILLRIGTDGEFKYVHIGMRIYEFITDEIITKYVSSVGNNCVPYPYAESKNWCYDMSENEKTPVSEHPNREQQGDVYPMNDKLTYHHFDIVNVVDRNSEFGKSSLPNKKKTGVYRFGEPIQVTMCKNTCADTTLPLVNQVNKALDNCEKNDKENV